MSFKLLGVGSPLVDYSLAVTDDLLEKLVPGGKGCTRNISDIEKRKVLDAVGGHLCRTPGGSAGNTVRMLALLDVDAAIFGKTGNDNEALFLRQALKEAGVDTSLLIRDDEFPTGYCLSLITPDAERTMLSDLGASLNVCDDDLLNIDFTGFDHLLLEGYLASEKWVDKILASARLSGCRIALDLNNYELVSAHRDRFMELADNGIDLLFTNIQEARSLFPESSSVEELTRELQKRFNQSVLKCGADGAWIIDQKGIMHIPVEKDITAVDTTGAGDSFAAGFFYGISKNCPLEICGKLGNLCAAAIISETGTQLSENNLRSLKHKINSEVKQCSTK